MSNIAPSLPMAISGPSLPLDGGRMVVVARPFGGRVSFRFDLRIATVSLGLLALTAVIGAITLVSGTFPVPLADILPVLLGHGEDQARMVVMEWRLPRLLLACLLGGALGMSGAIFQSLTRNPLGSPDIIGFATGSYSGALFVILFLSGGYYETALGALCGGVLTASAVYLLAYRRGVQGFRLIIVGIGISAMLGALNTWMIRKAELQVAMSAAIWGSGSLNGRGFEQLMPVFAALCLIVPPVLLLSRPMRQLEMGDDAARASGVEPHRVRLGLMVLGVALTAVVTAAAGPISFIALAAPQIAQRMTRSAGAALIPSALMGSLMLVTADFAVQHGFGVQLPVGVMTAAIGGLYFVWLLVREGRR